MEKLGMIDVDNLITVTSLPVYRTPLERSSGMLTLRSGLFQPFFRRKTVQTKTPQGVRLRLEPLEDRITPATTDTWTGLGADTNWQTAGNWVGNVAPNAGDNLVFPSGVAQESATNNFTAGTSFGSIMISGAGYTLAGTAVNLTGGLTDSGGNATVSLPINLEAAQGIVNSSGSTLQLNGNIDLNGSALTLEVDNGTTTVDGQISGAGGIIKTSGGTLNLAAANSYTGTTQDNGGTLAVQNSAALGTGDNTAATAVSLSNATLSLQNSITVGNHLLICTASSSDTNVVVSSGSDVWTGNVSFGSPSSTLLQVTPGAGSTLEFDGAISNATNGALNFAGSGRTILEGASSFSAGYAYEVVVAAGTVEVDGSLTLPNGSVFVEGGTLAGTGAVTSASSLSDYRVRVESYGHVAPGTAWTPGMLTVGNSLHFFNDGFVNIRIDGAGSYDQVNVAGDFSPNNAILNVTLGPGFVPAIGSSFTIVQSTAPIVTTFSGLAQGATFQVGSTNFKISYTGDKVVLNVVSQFPPALAGLPVVNGSSAVINIASASGDGTTATITTDGMPHGFWVGELVTLTGATPGGPGGLAGTVTVTAVPSATTFQFASTYSGTETLSGATVTAALAGAQRSMVDSIVYNFTEPVNLTAAAFSISAVVDNTGTSDKVGVAPMLNVAPVPFTNEWVVTFTDPVNNSVIGNSIANGAYSISINPALVTAVIDGQNMSAGETDTFYRLYGDVTGAQSVKNVDVNAFNRAWGNAYYSANYNAVLDYNDDGKFTNIDANALNRAFNTRYSVVTTI